MRVAKKNIRIFQKTIYTDIPSEMSGPVLRPRAWPGSPEKIDMKFVVQGLLPKGLNIWDHQNSGPGET